MKLHRFKNYDNDPYIGKIYNTKKSGKAGVLYKNGRTSRNIQLYRICFVDTGYEIDVQISNLLLGHVFDPLSPSASGVGYLGLEYERLRDKDRDLYFSLKRRWLGMLSRCYNKKNKRYSDYGKKGIHVCTQWHNFSNYYKDVIKLKGFDREKILSGSLELDKDLLQQNIPTSEKVYSKDTCIWIIDSYNGYIGKSTRKIELEHPDGTITIENSIQDCLKNYDLSPGSFYKVLKGKSKHVKNYKMKYYEE